MKAVFVTLVFHKSGELYFSSQAAGLQDPDERARWESRGYVVRRVEVFLPA